ncbi:hypothetical protein VKT23_016556 [Stygiomarasmius scandens]|uniref:Uncharacterized protein n=1 Tax=Marasmiellus scandens TaxID=2682957 RepID=A0ABR1IUJ1_9AGAR
MQLLGSIFFVATAIFFTASASPIPVPKAAVHTECSKERSTDWAPTKFMESLSSETSNRYLQCLKDVDPVEVSRHVDIISDFKPGPPSWRRDREVSPLSIKGGKASLKPGPPSWRDKDSELCKQCLPGAKAGPPSWKRHTNNKEDNTPGSSSLTGHDVENIEAGPPSWKRDLDVDRNFDNHDQDRKLRVMFGKEFTQLFLTASTDETIW